MIATPGHPGSDSAGEASVALEATEPLHMGLLEHLEELRSVLIQSGLAALASASLCWFWSGRILDILIVPIADQGVYFTAPNEAFLTRLKIAGMVGIFVVLPFILFRVYSFIMPGLYRSERRIVAPLMLASTLLFYAGIAFSFLVVIPQVITFLLSFGTQTMVPLIGVGNYFGFVSRMCLAFGLVFQLPLLVLGLSVAGILSPRMLLRTWRVAIIVIATIAAILTPPDVISQVMMAVPVLILYFGSVLVSLVVTRRRRNQD